VTFSIDNLEIDLDLRCEIGLNSMFLRVINAINHNLHYI
jgi:hypothetical protein